MPKTPLLGTIISFKDVTGNSCTVERLRTFLSPHNRSEVLFLCALLNTVLETWAGKVREDVHGQLVEMAFLPEYATRLKKIISSSSHPKIVFHRAQIIFVAKQAVLCCQDNETVLDRFRHPYWGGLGLAFLMANDLLHFDFAYRDGTTNQQALIRMTHSIPLLESGITPFSNKIGRAWLMLKKFGPAPSSSSYFNIEDAFHRTAGLSVEEYLAFCVGIFSHYLSLNFEQIAKMEDSIKPKIITPIFCLSSEGIEGLSAYLQDEPLSQLLHGWYSNDPVCYWSFQTTENSVMTSHGSKNNPDLDTAFKAVFENARQVLFPESNQADLD